MTSPSAKRRIVLGVSVIALGLVLAPVLACGTILATPGLSTEKFISEGDGSVGPAFYVCLAVWGGLSVLALVAGAVPLVMGLARRNA